MSILKTYVKNKKYFKIRKCNICNKIDHINKYAKLVDLCYSCNLKQNVDCSGSNNNNWKGGITNNRYCKCGNKMNNHDAKLCRKCYVKTLKGLGNPNYIDGRNSAKRYCKNKCGNTVSKIGNICQSCYTKYRTGNILFMGKNNPAYGKSYGTKRIIYKGIKFRSSWEVKYVKYLDKNGIKWEYEPKVFKIENLNTHYTPDFYLPDLDKYVEIKGHWYPGNKEKFLEFKRCYPHIFICLLREKHLKRLGVL